MYQHDFEFIAILKGNKTIVNKTCSQGETEQNLELFTVVQEKETKLNLDFIAGVFEERNLEFIVGVIEEGRAATKSPH